MGNFYVSFTTRGPKQADIAKWLRSAKRTAYVSPEVDGAVVFFDKDADSQDDSIIVSLGKQASKSLNAPVMAVLNHDDDILAYWLFEAGGMVDEYNSCPGYFSGGDRTPSGGNANKLCTAFAVSAKPEEVDKVLRDQQFVFALERHEALAGLLKQPWRYVGMGYNYVDEMADEKKEEEDFIYIA